MGTPLFTIGHGALPIDMLLRRLDAHGVRTILDVRSHPHSGRAPQYGKHELEAELTADGLSYRWLGTHLGGRPSTNPSSWQQGSQKVQPSPGVLPARSCAQSWSRPAVTERRSSPRHSKMRGSL